MVMVMLDQTGKNFYPSNLVSTVQFVNLVKNPKIELKIDRASTAPILASELNLIWVNEHQDK